MIKNDWKRARWRKREERETLVSAERAGHLVGIGVDFEGEVSSTFLL